METTGAAFSIGEHVQIVDQGWGWDRQMGIVRDVFRRPANGPLWYLVRVDYAEGQSVRYDFLAHQLAHVNE